MTNWPIILVIIVCGCSLHSPPAVDPPDPKKSCVNHFGMNESHVPIVSAVININPNHPEVHPPAKLLVVDTGATREERLPF
jgi:hypothetical protein